MDVISRNDRFIGPTDSDNVFPWIVSIPLSTTSLAHFLQVYGQLRVIVIILRGLFVGAVPLRVITCRQRRRRSLLATRMQVSLHDRYVNTYREISRVAFD